MMGREINFNDVIVNDDSDCYVIAEIGHNHQGDIKKAKEMIKAAADCGVNAVKLQKRDNRALYTKAMFDSPYDNPNSYGETYGIHRNRLELEKDAYVELIQYAKDLNITFFATPFDFNSAEILYELDMPLYKIASGDIKNIPLIKQVAHFGKPLIVSTGGSSMEDVQRVYDAVMPINSSLCIMQCTSSYPCDFENLNLRVIEAYRQAFPDVVIGLSGHDNGIAMGPVAYMLGARVIEKHFTLNRSWKGTDHPFSLERSGLSRLVRDLKRTRIALGDGIKRPLPCEADPIRKMAKKLVASRGLPKGHILTRHDIAIKSPGDGLPPYYFEQILGKSLLTELKHDENISLEILVDDVAVIE